jgi:L-asparaginase
MRPKIAFISTGGTIDKEYDALDKAFTIGNTAVQRILALANPNFEIESIPLLRKVSPDITQEDKELIRTTCENLDTDKIIITYGTDAMAEFAETIKDITSKTIVIVGALKSQLIKNTDAEFNLGFAVAAVQTMPYGVYIAMNGRVYNWNECKKDEVTGQFIEK